MVVQSAILIAAIEAMQIEIEDTVTWDQPPPLQLSIADDKVWRSRGSITLRPGEDSLSEGHYLYLAKSAHAGQLLCLLRIVRILVEFRPVNRLRRLLN